jgi:hypothetical protein
MKLIMGMMIKMRIIMTIYVLMCVKMVIAKPVALDALIKMRIQTSLVKMIVMKNVLIA